MRGDPGRARQLTVVSLAAVFLLVVGGGVVLAQPAPICVPPPPGMVGWWPGDGNTLDITGGHTGAWVGSAAYTAGRVGQAFSLASGSYVEVPNAPALNPATAITVDAWIHPTVVATDYLDGNRIVDKTVAGVGGSWDLDLLQGNLRFIVEGSWCVGNTVINAGQTYHVAGTYDGSHIVVYLNGVQDTTPVAYSSTISANTQPVRFGMASDGSNAFTGWIDEVEIFNRALSASEIQAIYNAGPAGKCKSQAIPAASFAGLLVLVAFLAAAGLVALRR